MPIALRPEATTVDTATFYAQQALNPRWTQAVKARGCFIAPTQFEVLARHAPDDLVGSYCELHPTAYKERPWWLRRD